MNVAKRQGRPVKYDFVMEVDEIRKYEGVVSQSVLVCAKNWVKRHGLNWKFRTMTENGVVTLIRVS